MRIAGGYNKIQRISSARDSAQLTDSGIAVNDNDLSHIYSEPTEDPNAYLDPVRIRLDPDEEFYMAGGTMSIMEGSVADTDYMDDYGRRAMPRGGPINVDKYKIRPAPPSGCLEIPSAPSCRRLSGLSQDKPISESEYSDGELFAMTAEKERAMCEYERQLLAMPPIKSDQNLNVYSSDESIVRKKLLEMSSDSGCTIDGNENDDGGSDSTISAGGNENLATSSINNLSKSPGSKEVIVGISTPNIQARCRPAGPAATAVGTLTKQDNRDASVAQKRSLPLITDPTASDDDEYARRLRTVLSSSVDSLGGRDAVARTRCPENDERWFTDKYHHRPV